MMDLKSCVSIIRVVTMDLKSCESHLFSGDGPHVVIEQVHKMRVLKEALT